MVSGTPSIIPLDKNSPASQSKQRENASWESEYSQLADEIQVRHYSKKTLKTYQGWMKKFQTFTHSKSPAMLSTDDVKNFLTFLAVKKKVSATTQNRRSIPCYSSTVTFCKRNSARLKASSGQNENPISLWFYPVRRSMPL